MIGTLYYLPIAIAVWTLTFPILKMIYEVYFRKEKDLRKLYKSWAIVTGATDGIGKALAFELAKRKFNLLLLSKNQERLEAVKSEIESLTKDIEVKIKEIDFSAFDDLVPFELIEFIEPFRSDIGILINNVGTAYEHPDFYHEFLVKQKNPVIPINILATTKMINIFLEIMMGNKASQGQRKGAIINISSASAALPGSLVSLYSASKVYIDQLTRGLHLEYKPLGIDIQSQRPCFVATKMSKIKKTSFFVCSPEDYAKAAMKSIGYGAIEYPYPAHKLQMLLTGMLPICALKKLYTYLMFDLRKRSLEKLKRNK